MHDVCLFGRAFGWKLFLIVKTFIDLWSGDWQEPRPLCVTVSMATCLTPYCHALSCPHGLNMTGHRLRKYSFIVLFMNSSLLITLTYLIRQQDTQKLLYTTINFASFYSVKFLGGFQKYYSVLCEILNACLILLVYVFIMLHSAFLNGSKIQDLCHFFIDYLTMMGCTLKTTISQEVVSTDYFVP